MTPEQLNKALENKEETILCWFEPLDSLDYEGNRVFIHKEIRLTAQEAIQLERRRRTTARAYLLCKDSDDVLLNNFIASHQAQIAE